MLRARLRWVVVKHVYSSALTSLSQTVVCSSSNGLISCPRHVAHTLFYANHDVRVLTLADPILVGTGQGCGLCLGVEYYLYIRTKI
jgi:hypothetical protein